MAREFDSNPVDGCFISFEGIDGAGKSSHIEGLAQIFRSQGRTVTVTREPGGTVLAETLRTLILNEAMDAMTEALLVFAARRDHLQRCIEPALARKEVVLCDRFTDATFAYQGGGRGFDVSLLSLLEQHIQSKQGENGVFIRNPDLTLWFDLDPEVAAQRLSGARAPDKFEAQPLAFFQKVREGYARRMRQSPQRFARIEADQTRDLVAHQVFEAVKTKGFVA